MRHVYQENRAHIFRHFGKTREVDVQAVGRRTSDDQLRFVLMRLFFHGVVVDLFFGVQTVRDHVEPFATDIEGHAVGQVTAFGQAHAHDGVAGLQERQENRFVGRRTAMRLHIGGVRAEDFLDAVNRELLCNVHVFTTTVVTLARIALCIFIRQLRALGLHDSGRGVVFAGDEFDVVFLTGVFSLNSGPNLWVGMRDQDIALVHEKGSLGKIVRN